MWVEPTIRDVAADQHGLITRDQTAGLGVTDSEIRWRIASGRLECVHPGVYYLDAVPATWRTAVLAAVMAAGPDALASHRCAGVLWDLDAVYGRTIEVTVPVNEEPQPVGVLLHRTRRNNDGAVLDGIPVTSPAKTILDLAAVLPQRVLEKAARSAIHRDLVSADDLDKAIGVFGGRGVKGTRRARRVVARVAEDLSGSVSEIDLSHIIEDAPVPRPVQQLQIRLPDGGNAYPDFVWPDRMRIVEADGLGAHGTPEQLQHDLRRQNQLMDLGWEIRRFTATDIRDHPEWVAAQIVEFVNKPFCAGL